ncbi:putative adh_zinc, Zinc-binding dehydrogenase [Marinomonas sp. MED121]|uniref:zinc-dependent alcohol dehydrogenase family protein n=1 Tax=Marinomonas sp. MED121 TaxID=314277 RepID=UPI0000690AF7|nr:zinc-dependent alcohol dehydrogenase family protein [Marinomonas sp. MED121]EAQ66132.1 putative adh_zinc, Zinc-binding dehydrogenase [Marinomonas sp. MED121]
MTTLSQMGMKAMVVKEKGQSDVFKLEQKSKPSIKPGHVLVQVAASSVNPLDTMLRSSDTPWSENLPDILHGDVAGTVVEIADDVNRFKLGDEIYGCAGGIAGIDGALAEFMLVDADLIALKPKTLSMRESAALPLVSITAWEALREKLNIQPREHILIHGAAGGVGHIAIQLAKFFGAKVSATSTPRNMEAAAQFNQDNLINVKKESVADYVANYANGKGFDAVFDTIAGENIQRSFDAVKINGSVVTTLPVENVLSVALKSLSFHSVLMLIPLVEGINRKKHGEILEKIATLVDSGAIKPLIDESDYSIWQVAKAHDRLSSGHATGKVVMRV